MNSLKIVATLGAGFIALSANAQSPAPIIVPAANANATPVKTAVVIPDNPAALQEMIRLLEDMKAANAETLKRQEAALQQLDKLEKDAEQLRIFTKR